MSADFIASHVNITKVVAEVLPQEKAQVVREMQQNGIRVAMVGDGINDAQALIQGDVGISFNAGTDIAIESADAILVDAHLGGVVDAYHIGKQSYCKTKQNVIFAFAFNGIGVPLAITGLVHPVFAMIAMAASVSVVLFNSYPGKIVNNRQGKQIENNNIVNADEHELELHTVNYSIPTILCEGCIEGVTESLEPNQGVISIDGDPIEKTLAINFQVENIKLENLKNTTESNRHKIEKEIIS